MELLRLLVLTAGMLAAVWSDCQSRKLPNRLTVSMAAAALALALIRGGWAELGHAGAGLLAGLAAGVILWLLGVFRGGDAKLLAAMGALTGWPWLLDSFCWAVMLGGAGGLILLLWKGALSARLRRIWQYGKALLLSRRFEPYDPLPGTEGELPFALWLAAGCLLARLVPLWAELL